MKTLKTKIAILFIILLTFSCGNDDEPNPANPITTFDYFLKAKIDGVQYDAVPGQVLAANNTDRLTISSAIPDNRNFELIIIRPTGIGTYTYPAPAAADYVIRMSYSDASSATSIWIVNSCSAATGTITISALSTTEVSGTFSFTGKRTSFCTDAAKIITEGSFKSGLIQ